MKTAVWLLRRGQSGFDFSIMLARGCYILRKVVEEETRGPSSLQRNVPDIPIILQWSHRTDVWDAAINMNSVTFFYLRALVFPSSIVSCGLWQNFCDIRRDQSNRLEYPARCGHATFFAMNLLAALSDLYIYITLLIFVYFKIMIHEALSFFQSFAYKSFVPTVLRKICRSQCV